MAVGNLVYAAGGHGLLRSSELPPEVLELVEPLLLPKGHLGIMNGRRRGRLVALVVDGRGEPRAVAKLGTTDSAKEHLRREAAAMNELRPLLPPSLNMPRVLEATEGVLVLEFLRGRPARPAWRPPREVIGGLADLFRAGRSLRPEITEGPVHGDFAPWNLLATKKGWTLIDWEEAQMKGRPLFDLFHYLVQSHALLHRPNARELLTGLEGGGWIRMLVDIYRSRGAISDVDPRAVFVEYLKHSLSRVGVSDPPPRRAIKARRTLLERVLRNTRVA